MRLRSCLPALRVGTMLSTIVLGLGLACSARAAEGGASIYLLGSGTPASAIAPPVQGVFFDNQAYFYDGAAGGNKQFLVGGNLVAGLNAQIAADFASVAVVPTTNLFGGVLTLDGALPLGQPRVQVSALLQGPLGQQIAVTKSDSTFTIGDPLIGAALGWKSGDMHYQLSELVNIPVGDYHEGQLANLAFHRWMGDTSMAVTWHDDTSGWDVSGKAGLSFNGTNQATHYTTGTEFHVEGSIEKTIIRSFSIGAMGYYYDQITGDSGAGAKLGPFEGRVAGLGATAAHTFALNHMPATLRLRAMTEFDARNRMEGNSVSLDLSVPLSLKLPKAPAKD